MSAKALCRFACFVALFMLTHCPANADEAIGPNAVLIPQPLLGLVHAPEVHKELKLSESQIEELEGLLRTVDARWFPARILPVKQQREINTELESQVRNWIATTTTTEQQERLEQLVYYAQGSRLLLRNDIAKSVGLSATQQQKLVTLARQTDEAKEAVSRMQYGDPELKGLQDKLKQASKSEQDVMKKIVRPDQWQKIQVVLGKPFDPTQLKRIYPLAPEFVPVDHWINSGPLTMRQLRGKVVLVHFYAFQCHNCHANFGIYRRWHQELTKKGVVVVGIQTPETSRERDPAAVETAARERDLSFPILIDLKSENWQAWGNTMWPCVYVIDRDGYIRMWWSGELNWKGATGDKSIEKTVTDLLAEQ